MEYFFSKISLDDIFAIIIPGSAYFFCKQHYYPGRNKDPERPSLSIFLVGVLFYLLIYPHAGLLVTKLSSDNFVALLFKQLILVLYFFIFPWIAAMYAPAVINKFSLKSGLTMEASSWNHAFRKHEGAYIKVTLKNGKEYFGQYMEGSHCSNDLVVNRQLFLQFCFFPKNKDFAYVKGNYGVLILSDEIETVHFFSDPYFEEAIVCPTEIPVTQTQTPIPEGGVTHPPIHQGSKE